MDETWGTTVGELTDALTAVEDSIEYGQHAHVALHLQELPAPADAENFYNEAVNEGFHITEPQLYLDQGVPTMSFVLRKGSPIWAALIPLLPTIAIAGLVAFGITKIETISKAIMPVLLTVVGGVVLSWRRILPMALIKVAAMPGTRYA